MQLAEVLIKPILTEKANAQQEKLKRFQQDEKLSHNSRDYFQKILNILYFKEERFIIQVSYAIGV